MEPEAVREIAEGRVWDGANALDLGLIDQLGSLKDAIAAAAELADLTDYAPVYILDTGSPGQQFLREIGLLSLSVRERLQRSNSSSSSLLRGMVRQFDFLALTQDPAHIYAHCLLPRTVLAP